MISIGSIILLLVALAAAAWALICGWSAARAVAHAPLPLTPENLEDCYFSLETDNAETTADPKLSVVVYVSDPTTGLEEHIRRLMAQRTLWPYELIIVCNASARETAAMSERMSALKGVRFTFVPPEALNLSRRKLAFTVGIKAARGEAVLLTAPEMAPSSEGWFQLMGNPILENPYTDLVIGSTRFDFSVMGHFKGLYRGFLWVTDKCQSLAGALASKPYRGDWGNLAMRRSFFFDSKGYGSTLNIETGDDDVFISRMADGDRTEVVLAPAAMPLADWGEWTDRIWTEQRVAYDFTSRLIPNRPFLIKGATSFCNWIVLLCCLTVPACSALSLLLRESPLFETGFFPSPTEAFLFWLPSIIAGLLLICFGIIQIILYGKAARRLMAPNAGLLLPLFMLWRPFGNLLFRQRHSEALKRNYTWQH